MLRAASHAAPEFPTRTGRRRTKDNVRAYPAAPPRMLPGYHDIAATTVPFFSSMLESTAADQFAPFPSLHVTWALWVAMALRALPRRRPRRILVWA